MAAVFMAARAIMMRVVRYIKLHLFRLLTGCNVVCQNCFIVLVTSKIFCLGVKTPVCHLGEEASRSPLSLQR